MSRLSEHDEFMAEEARAMDHARRVAAQRGMPVPGAPAWQKPPSDSPPRRSRPPRTHREQP